MACWRARGTECTYMGPFEGVQGPGERAVTPQETALDFPVSVQESPVEAWVSGGLLKG